ncbi:MATE family efflux transporter [uncultured Gemmiger sp.]|uniref:MATE family efflux transporter n=1 Tax=uncultured Gemmiger sp. TaxID=1623490 RepID=UPI0025CCDACC|nr:MATE family efflux transporter [uncultured Gemmiger sp.]
MNQQTMFLQTPPAKLFFMAAIPGAIGMLASALYQLADGILVGQFLDGTAFAALNLAMPFVIINFALADLIGVGSSVPISIALGQGRDKQANNYFTCACLMIFTAGILVGAGMFLASPGLIALMGAEGRFAELAVQYLRVYALCSPVTTIVFATDNYLRICGQIKGSMYLNILMSVLSAGLEFLFLGVFHWGIWAAALGTCLGMMVCAVIALAPFALGRMKLRFCHPRFSLDLVRRIVSCGLPTFLNNVAGRITSILMNMLLVRLGGEMAVSVYGVLMYADGFIQPILYGTCDSLQPAVGYNWGAGRFGRCRAIEKCCMRAAMVLNAAALVVIALFPEQIAGLFLADADTAGMAMAAGALRLFSLTYLTRWFSFWVQSYLLAVEKAVPATIISISTALIFPVLLLAALWPLGLTGIWLNFAGTAVLAGILAAILLRREWPDLSRTDAPVQADP